MSYAHLDAPTVYPEIRRLGLMGYRLWYDEGIDPGNEWPEEVAQALKRCALFIVFVTGRSVASRNVRNEIHYALKLNKPFVAIHLDETELPPGMDLQMSSIQAIFMWRMAEQAYIRNLERAISGELKSPSDGSPSMANSKNDVIVDLVARTMYSELEDQSVRSGSVRARINWHQLDPSIKAGSLAQCERMLTMLRLAGFNVSEARDSDTPLVFTSEDLDVLSRMEHDAWSRERFGAGWRAGRKDYEQRLHSMLVRFSEMPDDAKNKDRWWVQQLPALLLKAGYAITSMYDDPSRVTLFEGPNSRLGAIRH